MDATRTSDGVVIMLKRVDTTRHPTEVEMTTMFSSPPFSSEPRNHCIPVYDVLQDPDDDKYQLMVLPLLRSYASPRFDTIGEAIECFRQTIQVRKTHQSASLTSILTTPQGLCFLHENRIAHRYVSFDLLVCSKS